MGWVRLDDAFYDHPKFLEAGPLGIALWVACTAWSNRNLQDGFIPTFRVKTLLDWSDIPVDVVAVADRLVDCGLLEAAPGGYRLHDYHEYQPSAEMVLEKRRSISEARSAAGRLGGRSTQERRSGEANKQPENNPPSKQEPSCRTVREANVKPQPQPQVFASNEANTRSAPKSAFDRFWSAYPRRVERKRAEAAFAKAVRQTDPEAIIAGAERYAADPNRVPEFTKHPSTWLNGGCWDDEPLPPRSSGTTANRNGAVIASVGAQVRRLLPPLDPPRRTPAELTGGGST